MILIETEYICLNYYSFMLPVYNYIGTLLYPYIGKSAKLDIDMNFVAMIGLPNYINPKIPKITTNVSDAVESLSQMGLIILSFCVSINTYRFNISKEFQKKINDVPRLHFIETNELKELKDLEKKETLGLDQHKPETLQCVKYNLNHSIKYKNYFYYDKDKIQSDDSISHILTVLIDEHSKQLSIAPSLSENYIKKYYKYKTAYLKLKK